MGNSIGQTAYDAYCAQSRGVSLISGAPLPIYDNLPEEIRLAWECAAKAVDDRVRREMVDALMAVASFIRTKEQGR